MSASTSKVGPSGLYGPDYDLTPTFPDRQLQGTDIKQADLTEIFNRAYPPRHVYDATLTVIGFVFCSCCVLTLAPAPENDGSIRSPNIVALVVAIVATVLYSVLYDPSEDDRQKECKTLRKKFALCRPLEKKALSFFHKQLPPSDQTKPYYRLLGFSQVMELTNKEVNKIREIYSYLNPYLAKMFETMLAIGSNFVDMPCFADAVMNPADRATYQVTPLLLDAVISVYSPLYAKEGDHERLVEYKGEIESALEKLYNFRLMKLAFVNHGICRVAKFYFKELSELFREKVKPDTEILDMSGLMSAEVFDRFSGALLASSLDHLDSENQILVKRVASRLGIKHPPFEDIAE